MYLHMDSGSRESLGSILPCLHAGQMTALARLPISLGSEHRAQLQLKNHASEICFRRRRWPWYMTHDTLELQMKVREDFTIAEKAPTRWCPNFF